MAQSIKETNSIIAMITKICGLKEATLSSLHGGGLGVGSVDGAVMKKVIKILIYKEKKFPYLFVLSILVNIFSRKHTALNVDHAQCVMNSYLILNIVCFVQYEEAILAAHQLSLD